MIDFKMKIFLSIIGALIFSLLFVLLALIIPLQTEEKEKPAVVKKEQTRVSPAQLAEELRKN